MTINLKGNLYQDDGDAVSDATIQALTAGTTSVIDTDTTDSNGAWDLDGLAEGKYDVKISAGTSVRYIKWNDMISLRELDVRNDSANTRPAATFTNLINNASNQVAVFSGANTTRADNDEIYMSFKLANSAAELIEYGRMTVVATDVTDGQEDGQIEFDVMKSGTFTKVWTITSSTAGAMSFDMNVDSLTIGSGADTDISLTFDANTSDGVITWMEDEDYFQFSDDILMSTTERINLRDTAIYIYSSADGQLDLVADTEIQIAATTIDINGAVAFDGALTGITNITLSGTLSDGNYTFDTSGNVSGLGTVSSGTITTSGNIELGHASDTTIARSGSGAITVEGTQVLLAGAQTGVTTITNASLVVGRDADNDIDFTTDNNIRFRAGGEDQLTLTDGALTPSSNAIVDLGTDALEFKDAWFDGTVTSDAFAGPLTGNVTGTADVATVATTVTITDNESTNEDNALIFTAGGDVDGGNLGLESDGTLTYNPSTGKVTATGFIGALTGDVTGNVTGNTSGTAATVTTAAQTNITSLGTLTALQVDNLNLNGNTFSSTNSDGDITISGNDGGSTVVAQHIDMSAGGISVFGGGTASSADTNTKMYSAGAGPINILGTNAANTSIVIGRWSAGTTGNSLGGTLAFVKDRDTTIGDATALTDGDEIGKIWFGSGDGTVNAYTYTRTAAIFSAYSDGVSASNDNPAGFKWQLNPGGEDVNHAEVMRLDKNGSLLIGDTANANQTVGLTVNMGANDNETITLKSSDVTHLMTAQTEADTFGYLDKSNDSAGGLRVRGFGSSTRGLQLVGSHTTDTTSKDADANSHVVIRAETRSGTGVAAPSDTNTNILTVRGPGSTVGFIFALDGDLFYSGTTNASHYDDYDDIALLDTVRAVTTNNYKGVFSKFTEENAQILNKAGVITLNDDGKHFISTKGLNGLIIDSIRQLSMRTQEGLEELKEENKQLKQKLEALEV